MLEISKMYWFYMPKKQAVGPEDDRKDAMKDKEWYISESTKYHNH